MRRQMEGKRVEAVKALVPFFLVFVLFMVLVILPAKRHRRRMQALLDQVKVGDEVMMQSGQYGRVRALHAETVELEISDGVVTRWTKGAIAMVGAPASSTHASHDSDPELTLSLPDSKVTPQS